MLTTAVNTFQVVTFLEQELRSVIEQLNIERKMENLCKIQNLELQFQKIKKYYERLTPLVNYIFKYKEKFVGFDPLLLKNLALGAKFIRDAKLEN